MALAGVALIVGGASGIGRETALAFAERGADAVIVADIDEPAAAVSELSKKYASNPGYRAVAAHVDVCSRESVDSLVDWAAATFGRIDHFVHSAGTGLKLHAAVADIPSDEWDRVYRINGRGTFFCLSAATRVMLLQQERFVRGRNGLRSIGRGSIVGIGSLNGIMPVPHSLPYAASKYAALAVSMTAASELASQGVRINVVMPSWTDTPLMDAEIAQDPAVPDMVRGASPVARMAHPEEIAGAVCFLCGPDASYINGSQLVIDAGFSHKRGFATPAGAAAAASQDGMAISSKL